jgi:hypothetical protein
MSVLTVFFCGTGSNSFDFANPDYHDGELVTTLSRHHAGMEFVDWIVVDGPGSGNLQEDEKWDEPGNHWKLWGTLTGAGWEENVKHALAVVKGEAKWQRDELTKKDAKVLQRARAKAPADQKHRIPDAKKGMPRLVTPQQLQQRKTEIMRGPGKKETAKFRAEFDPVKRKGKGVTAVNLVGWSRGGVTCIMMANAMRKDPATANLPVRIFANDPVPGAFRFSRKRAVLGPNVREYVAVYSRDERSLGFAPVIPRLHGTTRRMMLSMPGRHATIVGNARDARKANRLPEPGRITRDLAEKCLRRWGTPLKNTLDLSADRLLSMYDRILRDDAEYRALRKQVYTIRERGDRDVGIGTARLISPVAPANPVFGSHFTVDFTEVGWFRPDPVFVNSHHRWLFLHRYGPAGLDLLRGGKNEALLARLGRRLPHTTARIAPA